ncbi:MAG: hypothetical protein BWY27_01160 [Bacteroidetes bacterium ADurb.Bin234]|nr:MAG: hypothetical protein BWY27_01160 [Bacteroidetes bacterium ADurb.Bin234]
MKRKCKLVPIIIGFFSSILAFLGIVTCCGLPIIAGILAWLGIGASQLSFFAEYRIWFIIIAIVALLFGFYQVYFNSKKVPCCETQDKNICCSDSTKSKSKKKSRLFEKIILWSGTVFIVIMFIVSNHEKKSTTMPQNSEEIQRDSVSTCCPN